jgi:hypothetical protein
MLCTSFGFKLVSSLIFYIIHLIQNIMFVVTIDFLRNSKS